LGGPDPLSGRGQCAGPIADAEGFEMPSMIGYRIKRVTGRLI
jgi:hypothetical protein